MTMLLTQIIAEAPAAGLPDPKSFASVGWLVLGLAAVAVALNQGFALWKNIRPRPERGGNVGRAELEERLAAQMVAVNGLIANVTNIATADRTYAHDKIHKLESDTQALRSDAEGAREGLHNRLFAQAELLNYLRGQIEGLMMAARASAQSADRAAQATERAADAIRHLPPLPSLATA